MRDLRFTCEYPYELVEYQSIGFSGREIRGFLQQKGVETIILSITCLPMEISAKLLKMSTTIFSAAITICASLERIPFINNQIANILVVGSKSARSAQKREV